MNSKYFFAILTCSLAAHLSAMDEQTVSARSDASAHWHGYADSEDYWAAQRAITTAAAARDYAQLEQLASQSSQQVLAQALYTAILLLDSQAVSIVLKAGIDLNKLYYLDSHQYTSILCTATGLHFDFRNEKEKLTKLHEIITLLLDYGADVNMVGGKYGYLRTPLTEAVEDQRKIKIAELLIERGAHINRDADPIPLRKAAAHGNRAGVELLLARGADVTQRVYREYALNAAKRAKYKSQSDRDETIQMLQHAMNEPHNIERMKQQVEKEIAHVKANVLPQEIENLENRYLGDLRNELARLEEKVGHSVQHDEDLLVLGDFNSFPD